MRKLLLVFSVLIWILTACVPTTMPTGGYIESSLKRDTNPDVSAVLLQALSDGNAQFAFDFYRQIHSEEGNLVFSPLSLSLALSMTLSGARGITQQEMLQALSMEFLGDDLHPAYNALLLQIAASENAELNQEEGSPFRLNIANSIWGQEGADFEQAFLDGLARHYGAGIYQVDYGNDSKGAQEKINGWVSDETEAKIPKLIPDGVLDPSTRLVLVNAIYFKASWAFPFLDNATQEAPFYLLDGSTKMVQMMNSPQIYGKYLETENYMLISLRYLSKDFDMLLIVPDEGKFKAVEESLTPEALAEAIQSLQPRGLNLYMPKFDIRTPLDAIPPLEALGMQAAFGDADFSGISKSMSLFISDVVHEATITVDEKGTEAAAATAVVMQESSAPEGTVIDRPFMFAIQHQPSGTILFMGRVVEP